MLDPARRTASRAGRAARSHAEGVRACSRRCSPPRAPVVTPEELVERAWDEQLDPLSNTVRMTVMTLRRKLGDPPLVETVRGSGYRV